MTSPSASIAAKSPSVSRVADPVPQLVAGTSRKNHTCNHSDDVLGRAVDGFIVHETRLMAAV